METAETAGPEPAAASRLGPRLALGAVLALAAALRLWRLQQNGFDNEYYAAGVRSMMAGWHNFFYNAFDPAGFVSVDKPPLALWIQVASGKIFGFSPLAILLPQVLEGVAAVAVLSHLVARRFGALTGVLAGLFLALTPIAVASDRSGDIDAGLLLILLLAAWVLSVAAERGSRGLLLLAMGLIGLGFNMKMLAAFVVLAHLRAGLLAGRRAPLASPARRPGPGWPGPGCRRAAVDHRRRPDTTAPAAFRGQQRGELDDRARDRPQRRRPIRVDLADAPGARQ